MMVSHEVEVFFDGDCPLCRREIDFLIRRDKHGRILASDIAALNFDAGTLGMTQEDFMKEIWGRLPNGEFIKGVEVFRRLYSAVGFGWMVKVTRVPGIAWCLDRAYSLFARHRLKLTGRCDKKGCALPSSLKN